MRQAGRAHPATTPKPIDEKPGRAASSSHPGGFTKFPSWEVDGLELEAFGRLVGRGGWAGVKFGELAGVASDSSAAAGLVLDNT